MIDDRPDTPAKDRLIGVIDLVEDLPRRPDEDDADRVLGALSFGLFPDSVGEGRGDWSFDHDRAAGYLRGFREAVAQVEESLHPERTVEEELLRTEHYLTKKIRNIDHSGRGSGCCQAEHGLKTQRSAVRWILFERWDLQN